MFKILLYLVIEGNFEKLCRWWSYMKNDQCFVEIATYMYMYNTVLGDVSKRF